MPVNARNITIKNAQSRGTGWTVDAEGLVTTEGLPGYEETTVLAAVQPITGDKTLREIDGAMPTATLVAHVYKNADGSFPTVRGAFDLDGDELPTLISYDGEDYEVQNVRYWTNGLIPHIRAEATLLGMDRSLKQSYTEGSDTVEY